MASDVTSRLTPVAEAVGTLARLADDFQAWLQRLADRVATVFQTVIAGFDRGYQTAEFLCFIAPSPEPVKPLTPDQQLVWDLPARDVKSAKELAIGLGFEASKEDMIRKRIARMRGIGWRIERVPGRGYWRPDAVRLDSASD